MRLCFLRDRRLSRFLDGELPLTDHRAVQAHLRGCGRCARRLAELRGVDEAVAVLPLPVGRAPLPTRLALSVAVAAALLASLAANLLLPQAPPHEGAPLGVPAPPSDTLSSLYARLAAPGAAR